MKKIKLLFMDVDGTLTDGKIYMGEKGEVMKAFCVKDGYAIKNILPAYDIVPVIITARYSEIVANRAKELNISEVYQSVADKALQMKKICEKYGLSLQENGKYAGTAFFGDDIPDIEGMKLGEIVGCPADAAREVSEIADYICKMKAGNGAAREFIEWIICDC